MKKALAALFSSVLLGGMAAAPAYAQQAPAPSPACQFILGFKTLHDLAPSEVGDCTDNQAFAPNGDAQQHTTKGLMAWRKIDNWTAFTNGYKTWINGPDGLVSRLNTDRFPWEKEAPAAAAPAAPAAPGVVVGQVITTDGPDETQALGDAPPGGFVPIPLPAGCKVTLTETTRFDAANKTISQPNGKRWVDIEPHLMCDGQERAISSLPQSTLDAACADALAKYQNQNEKLGFVFTAKNYLCPKMNDPFFLS